MSFNISKHFHKFPFPCVKHNLSHLRNSDVIYRKTGTYKDYSQNFIVPILLIDVVIKHVFFNQNFHMRQYIAPLCADDGVYPLCLNFGLFLSKHYSIPSWVKDDLCHSPDHRLINTTRVSYTQIIVCMVSAFALIPKEDNLSGITFASQV